MRIVRECCTRMLYERVVFEDGHRQRGRADYLSGVIVKLCRTKQNYVETLKTNILRAMIPRAIKWLVK